MTLSINSTTAKPSGDGHIVVRVFGMDASGKPFTQNACARNLSLHDALIFGLDHALKIGEIIGVQLEQRKARFRVEVVLDAREMSKSEFEVHLQDGQECPWKDLAEQRSASAAPVLNATKRRRCVRHKVDLKLEIRDEFKQSPMRVSATDASAYGCYVEHIVPLPVGTKMKVELWMDEGKLATSAVVRTRDPGLGMGIEFVSLTGQQRYELQSYLEKMALYR